MAGRNTCLTPACFAARRMGIFARRGLVHDARRPASVYYGKRALTPLIRKEGTALLIERIGETRLLILLAREDMQLYNISYDDLDWRDDHSREAIRRILEQANDETGFCTRDRRLLIEAIPGKNRLYACHHPAAPPPQRQAVSDQTGAGDCRPPEKRLPPAYTAGAWKKPKACCAPCTFWPASHLCKGNYTAFIR